MLEEGDTYVPEIMKKAARILLLNKMKNHFTNHNMEKCFTVAEDLLEEPPSSKKLRKTFADLIHDAAPNNRTQEGNEETTSTSTENYSEDQALLL